MVGCERGLATSCRLSAMALRSENQAKWPGNKMWCTLPLDILIFGRVHVIYGHVTLKRTVNSRSTSQTMTATRTSIYPLTSVEQSEIAPILPWADGMQSKPKRGLYLYTLPAARCLTPLFYHPISVDWFSVCIPLILLSYSCSGNTFCFSPCLVQAIIRPLVLSHSFL
jgi:hypothetical protein